MKTHPQLDPFISWFKEKGWTPWPFQQQAWNAYLNGKSGLITVPTGAGKSYAAFIGPLAELTANPQKGIQILYITPLRALARDLENALRKPIEDLTLPFRLESRTGDTSSSQRQKLKKNPPEILLTTPESLALMLSDTDSEKNFSQLQVVIVDEWHELLSSKRGVLLELLLTRIKGIKPAVRVWGLSATLGNPQEAADVLIGKENPYELINAPMDREILIQTILPSSLMHFPWAGMLGLSMLPYVLNELDPKKSTLIFTNTRSQAERWHRAIIESKPEWSEVTAIHHSSIDKGERERIETGVKEGVLRFIICTSSLDLGIDFTPVEKVVQIGSPKSIARLIQRAGRANHQPMKPYHISLVPTHVLELAEIKALRLAIKDKQVEKRVPLTHSYDVLLQHMMTCAVGGGFYADKLYQEVKQSHAFSDLTQEQFSWCLDFLVRGGRAFQAYEDYKKINVENGLYAVKDKRMAMRHKMNIGTIPSNPSVKIQFAKGRTIGDIEEEFISRLRKGDTFFFGGQKLELIQFRDLIAYVKVSHKETTKTPVWQGGRMPLSAPVSHYLRLAFDQAPQKNYPESELLLETCNLQNTLSHLPHSNELLLETVHTREGWHHFLYFFEGRLVHEGLAALLITRLGRFKKGDYTTAINDYGVEILSSEKIDFTPELLKTLFTSEHLLDDCRSALNFDELARSKFRDIARVAGLIFTGYPGSSKSTRQVQASGSVIFDVLKNYDPEHLLFKQAYQEVYTHQFQIERLETALARIRNQNIVIKELKKLSPFSLPLYIERISGRVVTEDLVARIEKIKQSWKKKT